MFVQQLGVVRWRVLKILESLQKAPVLATPGIFILFCGCVICRWFDGVARGAVAVVVEFYQEKVSIDRCIYYFLVLHLNFTKKNL